MRAASTDEDRWNTGPLYQPGSSHASPPLPTSSAPRSSSHLRGVGLPPPASSLARQPGHAHMSHVGPSMGPQATSQTALGYASSASSLDGAGQSMGANSAHAGPTVSPGTPPDPHVTSFQYPVIKSGAGYRLLQGSSLFVSAFPFSHRHDADAARGYGHGPAAAAGLPAPAALAAALPAPLHLGRHPARHTTTIRRTARSGPILHHDNQ